MTVQSGSRVRIPVFPRNVKQFGRCTFVQRFCVQLSVVESSLSKADALMRKQSRPGSSRIALLTDTQGRAAPRAANPYTSRIPEKATQGAESSAANPRPASPCVSSPASVKFTCALIPHYSALRGLLTAQVDTIWFHLRHQSAFYVHTGHIPRAGDFHDKDIFLNLKYFY